MDGFALGEMAAGQWHSQFFVFLEWQSSPESLKMLMLAVIKQFTELFSTVHVKICLLAEL